MIQIPNDAVFTYSFTEKPDSRFIESQKLRGSLFVNTTAETAVYEAHKADTQIVIVGLCVDAHGELTREDIPTYLLEIAETQAVAKLYAACSRLAGKYLIYFYKEGESYIWGDAAATLQIFYSSLPDGEFAAAVTENLVADYVDNWERKSAQKITDGVPLGQPFPAAETSFDYVKFLLSNHVLHINKRNAMRMRLAVPASSSTETVARKCRELIANIYRGYAAAYEIICPLTAGYDSRINFAFMKEFADSPQSYTFKHPNFTAETPDLYISAQLCRAYGIPYSVLPDQEMPEEQRELIRQVIGRECQDSVLGLGYTYKKKFGKAALLNGNIIDQVGKSVTGNAIPADLATPRLLRSRLYNGSSESLEVLRDYLEKIPPAEKQYVFDLVALEIDCGRWAGQSEFTYGLCGVNMLNLYNCRELIMLFMSLPRKVRREKALHYALFQLLDPELLKYDFTPETPLKRFVRRRWPIFYLVSFVYGYLVARRG